MPYKKIPDSISCELRNNKILSFGYFEIEICKIVIDAANLPAHLRKDMFIVYDTWMFVSHVRISVKCITLDDKL